MATSGSVDFTLTRDDIIKEALELLDSLATGATVPSADTTSANRTFNIFIKALQLEGVMLWTRVWDQAILTASSIVTHNSENYRAVKSHTASATDEPGVGNNWTTYWEKTSETANAGSWALSTAYNFIGDFTLPTTYISVSQAFIREETNGTSYDYPVKISPFGDYLDLTDKVSTTSSVPRFAYFDEGLSQLTGYLYPVPETDMVVHFLGVRTIEDFDSASDNPDFPVRAFEMLSLGLARRLAPKYGVWGDKLSQLNSLYEDALDKFKEDNKENSTSFVESAYPE